MGCVGDSVLESLWNRIRREDFKGYRVMVGICYRPPDQGEEVDKAFFKQLEEADELLMLVHMRDLNLLTSAGSATW